MFNLRKILMASVLASASAIANDSFIVRFDLTDSMKNYLKANEFDVTGVNYKTNEIEALLTQAELDSFLAQKAVVKFSFPQTLVGSPDHQYKKPDEIEQFVKDIHAHYPEITAIKSIGKSLEGRDIWAIKISDHANIDEKEPVVLINGMHHAREVMTPEITTDMIDYLTSNYGHKEEVTKWVDGTEIWVIPMFNVDGNNKMWTQNSMWRKNTRGGFGVDINRNYPTGWNTCNGSSNNHGAQDYHGTGPASEPETQAMMNFVAEIKPVFNISYHSYSEIVIYPFGCRPLKTPTGQAVEAIGAEIAKKLDYKPGTAWELLYNADGGDIDWMYQEHQTIPYVIEVNSTSAGFHPNYTKWRDKTVLRNRPGWMTLLNRLEGASVQGVVSQNDFMSVKIFIAGDTKVVQTYKINPDGSFYIILKPGTYDFSFEGAKTQKFTQIVVKDKKVLKF
jgi:carboxypeptidase T